MLWVTDLSKNEIGPNMEWDKVIDVFDAGAPYSFAPLFFTDYCIAIRILYVSAEFQIISPQLTFSSEFAATNVYYISTQTRMRLNIKLSL
jgi:CRISPR/Cas system CSM-associated protein Csm5 (group 7 of RAMP superfamily)